MIISEKLKYKKNYYTRIAFRINNVGGVAVSADSFMKPEPFEIWSEDGTKVFKWNPIMEKDSTQAGVYQNDKLVYSSYTREKSTFAQIISTLMQMLL